MRCGVEQLHGRSHRECGDHGLGRRVESDDGDAERVGCRRRDDRVDLAGSQHPLGFVQVGCRDRLEGLVAVDDGGCLRDDRDLRGRRLRTEDAAEHDRGEHGEHEHAGGDEERPAAEPHRDLAAGDERDAVDEARGAALSLLGAHRTTSLKIWASVVCSRVNETTSPRETASASTACLAASESASKTAQPPSNSSTRMPGCLPQPAGIARHEQLPSLGRVLGAQCVAAARGADASAGDDHQVVAEALDDVELVRREEHRGTGCRDIREHRLHRLDGHRVESRERLVEHEHLGAVHECRGDLRALLVAEREALDGVVRALAEAEALEQLEGVAVGGCRRPAVQAREVDGLLEQPHLGVEAAFLRHVAEAAAVGAR